MGQIVVGGVYTVDDDQITLPPNSSREYHDTRTVVVVSGPETNSDTRWKFVLVCPTSGSTRSKTRFCVKLNAGDGNLRKKCWARVPAVQPLLKDDLKDHWGVIPADKLELIQGRLIEYMGLLSEEEPPSAPQQDDDAPF